MKKVCVIISAYNCEQYVEEALRSILDQTYRNIEVVIADDGSTDGTKRIIDGIIDDRIRRYHNEQNMGLLNTWNKLIPFATGDYITWQDADDISYPSRIKALASALNADPELMLCGSNFCRPYLKWNAINKSNYPSDHKDIIELIDGGLDVPFPGTRSIIRREVLLEFAPFRDFFDKVGWEDSDMFCRISERYKVGNIPDVLYEYRYYSQSASKIKLDQITSKKVFIEEIGFFLAKQRKQNGGLDGLMPNGDLSALQEFLFIKELQLTADRSFPIRRLVNNKISNKDFWAALQLIPLSIISKPTMLANWILPLHWVKSLVRSIIYFLLQSVTGNYKDEYRRYRNNV